MLVRRQNVTHAMGDRHVPALCNPTVLGDPVMKAPMKRDRIQPMQTPDLLSYAKGWVLPPKTGIE